MTGTPTQTFHHEIDVLLLNSFSVINKFYFVTVFPLFPLFHLNYYSSFLLLKIWPVFMPDFSTIPKIRFSSISLFQWPATTYLIMVSLISSLQPKDHG